MSQNKDPKIPCYRVVHSNGQIGGYNRGLAQKQKQLQQEGVKIDRGKIDLEVFLWQKNT